MVKFFTSIISHPESYLRQRLERNALSEFRIVLMLQRLERKRLVLSIHTSAAPCLSASDVDLSPFGLVLLLTYGSSNSTSECKRKKYVLISVIFIKITVSS